MVLCANLIAVYRIGAKRNGASKGNAGLSTAQERNSYQTAGYPLLAVAFAVLASRPAAGAALTLLQLLPRAPNSTFAGGLLFGVLDPADELVARQGRDVVPGIERRGAGTQRLAQVSR